MAYEQIDNMWSGFAASDLTGKLHHFAKQDTDLEVSLAGDGVVVLGVLWAVDKAQRPVTVQLDGIARVIAAASFNVGVKLMSDTNGQAVTATTGKYCVGIAMEPGAAGRIVAMRLAGQGTIP